MSNKRKFKGILEVLLAVTLGVGALAGVPLIIHEGQRVSLESRTKEVRDEYFVIADKYVTYSRSVYGSINEYFLTLDIYDQLVHVNVDKSVFDQIITGDTILCSIRVSTDNKIIRQIIKLDDNGKVINKD